MFARILSLTTCVLALTFVAGCPEEEGDGGGGSGGGGGGGAKEATPEEAVMGACNMMGGGGGEECTGVDEYLACAEGCGFDACYSGACADYLSCVTDASDACESISSGACMPSSDCQSCLTDAGLCIVNMKCTDQLMCGTQTEGGPCDRVDACCASLDSLQKMACDLQASPVKSGGDDSCQQLLDGYGCD